MNILGVGIAELVVILLIALVVAGPHRMARWAYILGRYTAQFREAWKAMMAAMQAEFDEAGVDIQLPKDIPTRQDIAQMASDALKPLQEPMQQAMKDVEKEARQLDKTLKQNVDAMNRDLKAKTDEKEPQQPDNPEQDDADSFGVWSSQE